MKATDLVFVMGMGCAAAISLMIVFGAVFYPDAPKEVFQWGGTIVGFYFGTFFSFLKEYMMKKPEQP
jgi:hypothetical protein